MSIVDNIIAVAGHIADNFIPGASDMVAAAEGILAVAKGVAPTLASQDQDVLAAGLEPLLVKMDMDVDAAVALLRGTGA